MGYYPVTLLENIVPPFDFGHKHLKLYHTLCSGKYANFGLNALRANLGHH